MDSDALTPQTEASSSPQLVVGWVVAADVRDAALISAFEEARETLKAQLENQFPAFDWHFPSITRRNSSPRGVLDALDLLETGVAEKLRHRWDYAVVIVPNELETRQRIAPLGVPSSALEVAVLSTARLGDKETLAERVAALAQHLLGHLFTLETRDEGEGPMQPPVPEQLKLEPFPADQAETIEDVLSDVADARLEEMQTSWNYFTFYLRSFSSDPWNILRSIWGYRPWRFPLYLGRLTAAVVASLLFLLLTAESWEAGAQMRTVWLVWGTVLAIVASSLFIFFGQNLNQVGRGSGWSEQLARSRIVIFGTLLSGMVCLWVIMFALLYVLASALPGGVTSGWAGLTPETFPYIRYVSFMALVGMLAAALGGNLEEEDEIKAQFFVDEEV